MSEIELQTTSEKEPVTGIESSRQVALIQKGLSEYTKSKKKGGDLYKFITLLKNHLPRPGKFDNEHNKEIIEKLELHENFQKLLRNHWNTREDHF